MISGAEGVLGECDLELSCHSNWSSSETIIVDFDPISIDFFAVSTHSEIWEIMHCLRMHVVQG